MTQALNDIPPATRSPRAALTKPEREREREERFARTHRFVVAWAGDLQAKQLLLRTFRNEILAAANAGHVAEKPWSAA
jgi:hypothetical protein